MAREHFRQIYEPTSTDQVSALDPGKIIFEALVAKFGADHVRRDAYAQKGASYDFPVYTKAGEIDGSLRLSTTLSQVPTFSVDRVYVSTDAREEAEHWVSTNREKILTRAIGQESSNGASSKS